MIYELAVVAKTELDDSALSSLKKIIHDVVAEYDGEILLEDDWGRLSMAQPTSDGVGYGNYLFFIFKANNKCNVELARRFRINEGVIKSGVFVAAEDDKADTVLKRYKTPFSKKYPGSVTDIEGEAGDMEKSRKRFSRQKSCWFKANKIKANWKDPQTYNWLVNEFGKISPARVTGVCCKEQRNATSQIKRARQLGIASHISSRIAQA